MSNLKLPRMLGNGAIIQRDKPIHIWGWSIGESVQIVLSDQKNTVPVIDGKFDTYLDAMKAGGPYSLTVSDEKESITSEDIYIGEVLQLIGQSNIEFPMYRVRDMYPEEFEDMNNTFIREFKIPEHPEYLGPIEEHVAGEWKCVTPESFPMMSVIGYFTAKKITAETGVHVGLLNTTMGGSPIECWMSAEMLAGYDEILAEAEKYKDPDYVKNILDRNVKISENWYGPLATKDEGNVNNWMNEDTDTSDWKEVDIPFFFKDHSELKGFIGSIWFKKKFNVPANLAGKELPLWFGVMVDSDIIYVNGKQVGTTPYVYPPRRYTVPAGLLREGENDITVCLRVEKGHGRFTPGKIYGILSNIGRRVMRECYFEELEGVDEVIKLDGSWKYKIGTTMPRNEDMIFASWKPTALYNGMLYPCFKHAVRGLIWYQGESNCDYYDIYHDEFTKMINGFRDNWGDKNLPVYYIQLPNFIDYVYEEGDRPIPEESFWVKMQRTQAECQDIPNSHMVVSIGTGEDNDLHPQGKKPVAEEIAKLIIQDINK